MFTFAFHVFVFEVKSKESPPRLMSRILPLMFSCISSNGFRSYVQVFDLSWLNCCIWYKISIQFHYFAVCCPAFPITIYGRDCSFLIEYFWLLCNILSIHVCMGLFLDSILFHLLFFLFLFQCHTFLIFIIFIFLHFIYYFN